MQLKLQFLFLLLHQSENKLKVREMIDLHCRRGCGSSPTYLACPDVFRRDQERDHGPKLCPDIRDLFMECDGIL